MSHLTVTMDEAMAVACPGCGSAPGVTCRTLVDGLPLRIPHKRRVQAAEQKN